VLAVVGRDQVDERGQRARGDGESALAALGRERERIRVPPCRFVREALVDLGTSPAACARPSSDSGGSVEPA
jgi:hypothetical protein